MATRPVVHVKSAHVLPNWRGGRGLGRVRSYDYPQEDQKATHEGREEEPRNQAIQPPP